MNLHMPYNTQAAVLSAPRQGHVWGIARIGEGGETLYSIQDQETLGKIANVLLEPQQEAKTFKDPEDKDIIVTGEDLDILEAQKKVVDQARHHGDKFILQTAMRNLDALKSAVSVNASFVDASIIEDNPNYLNHSRHLTSLDTDGTPAHQTPQKKRGFSVQEVPVASAATHPQVPDEAGDSFKAMGVNQFMEDVSTLFNDILTQPDAFFSGESIQSSERLLPSEKNSGELTTVQARPTHTKPARTEQQTTVAIKAPKPAISQTPSPKNESRTPKETRPIEASTTTSHIQDVGLLL